MKGTLHMKTQATNFKRTELAEPYGVSEKLFSCTQTEKSLQQNQLQQKDAKERTMHKKENNLRTKTIETKMAFARQDRWHNSCTYSPNCLGIKSSNEINCDLHTSMINYLVRIRDKRVENCM
jgi:hypothetical protein